MYGNDLPAIGGFGLAAGRPLPLGTGLAMLVGLSAVMAGACVANNLLDQRLDALMERTHRRALPSGRVSRPAALIYSATLTLAGLVVLALGTTTLAAIWAALGWLGYVGLYGYAKRRTRHGTLVGSLAGAVPPVVGYTAVTGRLDATAWWLFLIMAIWQMPHFYAIAIFRLKDYQAAGVPVLPAVVGQAATRRQIIGYIGLYGLVAVWLPVIHPGMPWALAYAGGMAAVSLVWLVRALRPSEPDCRAWARGHFRWSLIVLLVWSALIALG